MTRWIAVVCIVLAGCASHRDPTIADLGPTLIGGMGQIRDKAVDPPDLDRLFANGLSHLATIDPDLRANITDDEVTLSFAEMTVAHVPRPRSQDIGGWTNAVQTLIAAGRTASKPLSDATSEALLEAIYDGVMPLLDPYSHYYGPREARRNRNVRNGFVGLGFDLDTVPKGASVRSVVKDGPADLAGILPDDIVTRAQGRKLASLPMSRVLRMLDGPRDSTVRLRILRSGAEFDAVIRRTFIIPETVISNLDDGVLYLMVKSFNQRTTAAITEAVGAAGKLRGIIIDLRGDPGGLLDQAVSVADLFLETGVIATLRGRHPGAMQFYAATPGDIAPGVPIVMLMDGRSASASEILGAALQDNGRAFAVGTATVGKGTVQTIVPLANGGEFALTWTRVFTPSGAALAERGVLPNVCTGGAPKNATDLIATVMRAGPRPVPAPEIVRSTCRPEPRAPENVDLEVARRMIADPALRLAVRPAPPGQIATTP